MITKQYLIDNNPWKEITKKMRENNFSRLDDYILKQDAEVVKLFNQNLAGDSKETYKIHPNVFPSHFTGNILNAKVILLTLNPGYNIEEEEVYGNIEHLKEVESHLSLKNQKMLSESTEAQERNPYYYQKLKELISVVGSLTEVSEAVGKIQFFPYHTEKYKNIHRKFFNKSEDEYLSSQKYGLDLVNYAIQEKKMIIVLRSQKLWEKQVKELKNYENKIVLNSYLNPSVSSRNMQKGDFDKIVKAIKNKG